MAKATVSRLVATLVDEGYLVADHAGRGYRLSAQVLSLARAMRVDEAGLVATLAQPVAKAAGELGAVVGFGTILNGEVVYLVVSNRDAARRHQAAGPGMRVPVFATGVGIACVAALDDLGQQRVIARIAATSTDAGRAKGLVARAKRQIEESGYCSITYRDGRSASIALPVVLRGQAVYAFTISYAVGNRSAAVPERMLKALRALDGLVPSEWRVGGSL